VTAVASPARIAVIGGGGFIGRPLVARLLAAGKTVRVMSASPAREPTAAEWVVGDVRDGEALRRTLDGMDLCCNLAAAHGLNTHAPEVYRAVNVEGAGRVCDAVSAAGIRHLVFTSSADVYGQGPLFTEATPPQPLADYGVTKLAAEGIYRGWAGGRPDRSLVIVRPTVVFGPGDIGAAARFLRHIAGPDFAHFGEARNRRSMACVDNVAAFLAFVMDGAAGVRLFNYADQPDLTVAEIVAIVRSALELPPAPHRSLAGAYAASLSASLRTRFTGAPSAVLPVRTLIRQLSLERRLDSSLAHGSGFAAPVALADALAQTARADLRWVALLSKARA